MFLQVFNFWLIWSFLLVVLLSLSFIYICVDVCIYTSVNVCYICVCMSTYTGNTLMNCFTLLVNLIFVITKWPSWSLIILFCLKMMPHKVSKAPGLERRYIHSQDVTIYHKLEQARQKQGELSPTRLLRLRGMHAFCPTNMMFGFFLFFSFCHNLFYN